jgi:hypothetical protein
LAGKGGKGLIHPSLDREASALHAKLGRHYVVLLSGFEPGNFQPLIHYASRFSKLPTPKNCYYLVPSKTLNFVPLYFHILN